MVNLVIYRQNLKNSCLFSSFSFKQSLGILSELIKRADPMFKTIFFLVSEFHRQTAPPLDREKERATHLFNSSRRLADNPGTSKFVVGVPESAPETGFGTGFSGR